MKFKKDDMVKYVDDLNSLMEYRFGSYEPKEVGWEDGDDCSVWFYMNNGWSPIPGDSHNMWFVSGRHVLSEITRRPNYENDTFR